MAGDCGRLRVTAGGFPAPSGARGAGGRGGARFCPLRSLGGRRWRYCCEGGRCSHFGAALARRRVWCPVQRPSCPPRRARLLPLSGFLPPAVPPGGAPRLCPAAEMPPWAARRWASSRLGAKSLCACVSVCGGRVQCPQPLGAQVCPKRAPSPTHATMRHHSPKESKRSP